VEGKRNPPSVSPGIAIEIGANVLRPADPPLGDQSSGSEFTRLSPYSRLTTGQHHKLAGHEPPTNAESVKAVVRGIRRAIGCAPVRKSPATADLVMAMLEQCDGSLIGLRDRALLALGFAGAFRRSELVALQGADLEATAGGIRVMIRRSKTDQEGEGQEIAIPPRRSSNDTPGSPASTRRRSPDIPCEVVF
jgi:integrase